MHNCIVLSGNTYSTGNLGNIGDLAYTGNTNSLDNTSNLGNKTVTWRTSQSRAGQSR